MKRYLFSLIAIGATIASLAFTSASKGRSNFVCQWYVFDRPDDGVDTDDVAINFTEATSYKNYRLATSYELTSICNNTLKLCAICAEPNVTVIGKPDISNGSIIYFEILLYFTEPIEANRVPSPSWIKEKYN